MQILVVDDKPVVVKQLTALLEEQGYFVVSAVNGLDALEKAQTNVFDLYIVDHLMPVMNGLKLVKSLKKKESTASTPILFMTTQGVASLEQVEEYALFDALISKPIDQELFYGALNQLLPQNTLVQSL